MFWFHLTRPQTTLLLFVDYTILTLLSRNLTVTSLTNRLLSTDAKTVVNSHSNELPYKFAVNVKECQDKLPTMYCLPRPYKARFIANASSCTTTELSKLLTSRLTVVKSRGIWYYETVYERSRKNIVWSIKYSGEVLSNLKSRGFRATSLSTYDFSTLSTLPHKIIKEKLLNLIERAFKNEGTLYLACNNKKAIFTSTDQRGYKLWSCQNVCDAFRISWIIFTSDLVIRYTDKLLVFRWVHIFLLL